MIWEKVLRTSTSWIAVLLFVTSITPYGDSASFYGASHLKIPLQDAQSTTDIYLKFRTHKPNALLFLAAGSIDYCLIVLEGGEIKVRINLGAGEAVLASPVGLRLNDLLWHDLELHRRDAELNLLIDSIHSTYLDIPGRFFELNIKYGVFVGGMGTFSELFLGNLPNFRGCIDDILFNEHNILAEARESPDQRNNVAVSWDCSEEFEALSHQPISFVEPGSFVALPSWNARNGASISFDMKTQSHLAVLCYKSGVPSKADFFALEILNGKVALSVNEGNGIESLQSDVTVSDGLWHRVDVQFSPSYIELDVDGQIKNLRLGLGENRFFDLAGFFYLGGIELNKRLRALQNGLQSILSEGEESSLKGCFKSIKINDEHVGLREAEVTQGIQPDCAWEFPCVQEPCIEEADCYQDGLDNFRCLCEQDVCVKTNFTSGYKLYTKSSLPIDLEILALHPLVISEGGSDLITSDQIQILLDIQKYGVRESGVLFHIIDPPKHGTLEIAVIRSLADNIFTLLDVNTDKVRYSHDGSETMGDSVVIELEFRANNFRLPSFLEERHRFVFHIQMSPVNDPPKMKLPPGKVLRLAKFTKRGFTRDILEAEDPDTSPRDLVYTVLSIGSGESGGFIENAKNPGKSADTFTQQDVDDGVISYVHRGEANTRLALRVSDGIEAGQTAVIRVATFDLVISLVNNTGIVLPYNNYALISADNLTFADNSPDQNLEIRYDITKLPQYGSIQRLRNNNRWHTVNHFTQRQLKKEKLRYIHTSGRPVYDEFKFSISCMDITVPTIYDFRITFIAINLSQIINKELVLEKKLDGHVTELELKYQTFPIVTPADQISYKILSTPSFGSLIQFHSQGPDARHKKLEIGGSFSQHDIDSKHIKYKLHRKSYSAVRDSFTFQVECPGKVISEPVEFIIRHIPSETDAVIVNERLSVLEGGAVTIGPGELHVETPDAVHILYNITSTPKHGVLKLLNVDLTETEVESPLVFASDHIVNSRLIYTHDDSENDRDSFNFVAYAGDDRTADDGFVYYGTLHINVIMKNDNPPIREVDKVFHVVLDGERKLTSRDLKYVDADIDSKPSDIQYTRRGFPNGALFHVDNMDTQVYQFTQTDLDESNILFRHSGAPYGKAVLRITDGKFYATGILEIQASKPFIKISSNTGLVLKRGENGLLSSANLTVETNLNEDPGEITFKITSSPKHGEILLNGKPANEFKQKDLDFENVEYENDNSVSFRDHMSFAAFLGDSNVEGTFEFRIYPDVYWEPLRVLNNKTIYVDEEKAVVIDSSTLSVFQANISPDNITYIVTTPPKHGFLMIGNPQGTDDWKSYTNASPVSSFTQNMINERQLHLVNTEKNVSEDSFTFDVSNGITMLRDLRLNFNIISKIILLRTSNITVIEGSEVPLRSADIGVSNPYYADWVTEYLVIEKPQHGYISNSKTPGLKLLIFQSSHLKHGFIRYVHDGTETSRDWFTLVANASALGKESSPSTIHVLIEPVNDEAPHVVNNTGLDMWEGDVATITNVHLAAADDDSEPEEINFVISSPSNGYVALKNDTRTPILAFTQDQIARGLVVFVHTGDKAGGFRIQVNDGVNYDSPHVFTVTSRVLQIIISTNEKLSILPRMQQSITKDHLFAGTNDHQQAREVLFRVTKGPTLGRVLVENTDGSLTPVSQFTQDQITKNLILYEHTQPMSGLTALDVVIFDVEAQHAQTIKDVKFQVEISVGNFGSGNLDQMVQLHALDVKEGGSTAIGQEHLDLSRLFSLWQGKGKSEFAKKLKIVLQSPPEYGWLEMDGDNFTSSRRMSFTREDIRKRKVQYHHDDSETFADNFTLGFYLADETGYPDILLFNGTVNVTIKSVNDQPFEILTRTSLLEVVQGQSALITAQVLCVRDADGVDRDIVYETIIAPQTGKLILGQKFDSPVQNFSQDDVNQLLVRYFHDGTKENRSGYHFKVSDGKHKQDYAVLNIVIVPVTLQLINTSVIEVQQGSTAVFLNNEHLGAVTNGNNAEIWYNITSLPSYGHIFVNDGVVRHFRQVDIDKELVFYMQSDLTVADDYFTVTVSSNENTIINKIVNITVIPLVKQKPLNASASGVTILSLTVLDATKLAEQTGSNPKYVVTKMPKYGVLRKSGKYRSKTKRKAQKNFEFTHQDIAQKLITYEGKDTDLRGTVADSFEYLLTAPQVQPARGRFIITVHPRPVIATTTTSVGGIATHSINHLVTVSVPKISETITKSPDIPNKETYHPVINDDNILIIAVSFGVVLIILIAVVIILCRVSHRRRSQKQRPHHVGNSVCHKEGKVHGSHTVQSDLENSDNNPSNGSLSISDDSPPPPPPTSPSSTGSRGGCIGGGTPKQRTLKNKNRKSSDADPSLPPPPYILENGEWTEIASSLPTCKVTPISHGDISELNETTLKSPYMRDLSEARDADDWRHYDGSDLRYGPVGNPVLRKNQYWV